MPERAQAFAKLNGQCMVHGHMQGKSQKKKKKKALLFTRPVGYTHFIFQLVLVHAARRVQVLLACLPELGCTCNKQQRERGLCRLGTGCYW